MSTLAHSGWFGQALRVLPGSWLAALDAWSYGLALKRRNGRRLAARPPKAEPIDYKLRHWRD
jgi:hypothetical protein